MTTSDFAGWTITPEDDAFHDSFEGSDHPWWVETFWTSFNVPERKMGGWLYNQVLKNQGENGLNNGGAWVWDAGDAKALYERYAHDLPMAAGPRDLRDIALPNGNRIRQLVPNMSYHMTYADPGGFEADLQFDGIIPPTPHPAGAAPFWRGRHFDQPMHVTGEIILNGERIAIDCLSMRDRSWSARPPRQARESQRTDGGKQAQKIASPSADGPSDITRPLRKPYNLGYIFGTESANNAFLIYTLLIEGEEARGDFLTGGWLLRDGIVAHLVKGERRCLVDPDKGWIWRIEFEGEDTLGRKVEIIGEQASNHGTSTGLFLWKWNGVEGWGENQGGIAAAYPRVARR
ncbi:MAG: tyrosine-protein kinase [Phenylobacterium sp.]|nr:tyrosine-protein kinase [Phenylobacterium sp.]